jgi:hypothetical protein
MNTLTREHSGAFIRPAQGARAAATPAGRSGARRSISVRQARRIRAIAAVALTLAVIAALLLVHLLG